METVDFSFGSFSLTFRDGAYVWYFAVHPEMYPARHGVTPSGNYCVYCMHPVRGSCFFTMGQDGECCWFTEAACHYIPPEIVGWLGNHIENRDRQSGKGD